MISEKSDSVQEITRSNDGLKWSEDETIENSDDDNENEDDDDDVNEDEYDDNTGSPNESGLKVKVINLKFYKSKNYFWNSSFIEPQGYAHFILSAPVFDTKIIYVDDCFLIVSSSFILILAHGFTAAFSFFF